MRYLTDELSSYEKLKNVKPSLSLKNILTAQRVKDYSVPITKDLTYNFAAKKVDDSVLALLQELADEGQLLEKFKALYEGEVVNTGEKRMVLHHLTRGQLGKDVGSGKSADLSETVGVNWGNTYDG